MGEKKYLKHIFWLTVVFLTFGSLHPASAATSLFQVIVGKSNVRVEMVFSDQRTVVARTGVSGRAVFYPEIGSTFKVRATGWVYDRAPQFSWSPSGYLESEATTYTATSTPAYVNLELRTFSTLTIFNQGQYVGAKVSAYTSDGTFQGFTTVDGSGNGRIDGIFNGYLSYVFVQSNNALFADRWIGGTSLASATGVRNADYIPYFNLLRVGLVPRFSTPSRTTNGFTVFVSNFDSNYTWNTPTVSAGSVSANVSGGVMTLTVTGLNPGQSATITQTNSRTGYEGGSGTVTGTALLPSSTPQATLQISNSVSSTFAPGSRITLRTTGGSGSGVVSFAFTGTGCSLRQNVLTSSVTTACVVTATKAAQGAFASATSAPLTFVFAQNRR